MTRRKGTHANKMYPSILRIDWGYWLRDLTMA